MTQSAAVFTLSSADETAQIARRIGHVLQPGDCVLLEGPIGAGKTHFARALIQSRLHHPEDVPSPTFTLVQIYDLADAELWHADLYRLTSLDEIEELGLSEALQEAICLIEWPDRLAEYTPAHALHLSLALVPNSENQRQLKLCWSDEKWRPIMQEISEEFADE